MANPFCHVELHASDTSEAKKFYGELLDWSFEDMETPMGPYTMVGVGDGVGGGIMANPQAGAPSHWLAYIEVDDVAASVKKAAALGDKILQDKIDIPAGSFAVISDPTGAAVGLFQAPA
jgi:predicted enzyme related to lactoylglutathione lyase